MKTLLELHRFVQNDIWLRSILRGESKNTIPPGILLMSYWKHVAEQSPKTRLRIITTLLDIGAIRATGGLGAPVHTSMRNLHTVELDTLYAAAQVFESGKERASKLPADGAEEVTAALMLLYSQLGPSAGGDGGSLSGGSLTQPPGDTAGDHAAVSSESSVL